MNGDTLVRRTGYAAVLAVSAVAALLSYWHAVTVVGRHGEPGVYGHLYPATIDGLIVAASMVLLDAARNHEKAPRLAWWLVGAGILGTLAANVLDGISYGFLGSLIAAWPAAAFVGAYEMIMVLIRSGARRAEEARKAAETPPPPPAAPELSQRPLWDNGLPPLQVFNTEKWREREAARPDDTQAVPVFQEQERPTGHVQIQSPVSRLDRKVPMDYRATGSFPAVKD